MDVVRDLRLGLQHDVLRAGPTSATVTRAWQTSRPPPVSAQATFPLFYGDRLVIVQRAVADGYYRLSEVMLGSGSFSLTIDGAIVANTSTSSLTFGAFVLDPRADPADEPSDPGDELFGSWRSSNAAPRARRVTPSWPIF